MEEFHGSRTGFHYIKKPTANRWPKNFMALYCHAKYLGRNEKEPKDWAENLLFGELVEWQAHTFMRDNDGFSRGQWHSGEDAEDFWRTLTAYARKQGTVWVVGWNIWPNWCLLGGVGEVAEQRLILDIRERSEQPPGIETRPRRSDGLFVAENPPTIICLSVPGGGRIKMVDLANYGIEPHHFGVDGPAGALSATVHAFKEYCRFCKVYNLGSLQTTAASQAWYCFRRSHMQHKIVVNPMEDVLQLEQAAYYGGRCECFRIGHFTEKLYHLDVNSMYTALAAVMPSPTRHVATIEADELSSIPNDTSRWTSIADVTVDTRGPCLPVRDSAKEDPFGQPKRKSSREKIIYPVGSFRTALCEPELFLAMSAKIIRKVHRIQIYERADIMRPWGKWALAMRDSLRVEGFSQLAGCCKKIINSLPGKWGQRQRQWRDFNPVVNAATQGANPDEWFMEWGRNPETKELTPFRTIAGVTQYQDKEFLSACACPAIAAFWTSFGRIYLWLAMLKAEYHNIYYVDTDSMIVNQEGFENMCKAAFVDDRAPGKWKLKECSDDVEILGIRRYRFGKRWCVAGPFGGELQGQGQPGQWTEHEGFGHQLWHRTAGDPVQVKRIIRWRKDYRHGVVDSQGTVHPFALGECLTPAENSVK